MSGGYFCRCSVGHRDRKNWRVTQRHCNHSAFNGYHYTLSAWSSIICLKCNMGWRTKAAYVNELQDYREGEEHELDGEVA